MAHLSNIEGIEMEGKLPEVRLASTPFKAVSPYEPAGDQPQAIEKLATGVKEGLRYQNLLGVTGSGKTFTMAKVIEAVQKPTLVMAPNKTLAAQLASELKEFFPDNAVVYFVSYYDYYQPEAYVPSSDTFIEKDASINEEVEKLRHAATSALLSRRDCIVVASVSCIYGIGSPMDYAGMAVFVDKQKDMDRDQVIHELIDIQYDRNDYEQKRGTFRVRGDALDVFPPYADHPIRIEVGMGKGQFILEQASRNPDVNFVGIEKYSTVLLKAIRKREQMELSNIYFLCEDARELAEIFGPGEVERIYLNFSDPWPKDRHARRRLTSPPFMAVYDQILQKDGRVEFKTDNQDLFSYSLEAIPEAGWRIIEYTRDLHHSEMAEGNVMTEYEAKFSAQGKPICKLVAVR